MKYFTLNSTILFLLISIFSCCTIIQSNKNYQPEMVVLTFDDGPNGVDSVTLKLLDVLRNHNVKAHFCLVGSTVLKSPDIVQKIYRDGHSIVNHGLDDNMVLLKSNNKISIDMDKWLEQIRSTLNEDTFNYSYYRPPYGMYRPGLHTILSKKKLQILPVSFYALDAQNGPSGKQIVLTRTLKELRKHHGGVIVLHDGRDSQEKLLHKLSENPQGPYNRRWIPEAVDRLITILEKENYRFVQFSEIQRPR